LRNLQPETLEAAIDQVEVSEPALDLSQAEESLAAVQPVVAPQVAPIEDSAPVVTEELSEVQPIVTEAKPESVSKPSVTTWWTQSADDEGEAPIAELPEPVRMVSTSARLTASAPSAAPSSASRPPITRAMRDRLPERATREPRRREARPAEPRRTETPAPAVSSVNVDPLVEQLEADKFNHTVRLELARAWWSMGNRESALAEYGKLINPAQVENLSDEELAEIEERDFAEAGPLADDLVVDLERIVEIDEHPAWSRLLGDLYMKTGDLARALEMYRHALSQL
jgi:tetratricopeptide (TPR) repeat protein